MSEKREIIISGAPASFLRRKTIKRHFGQFGTLQKMGVRNNDCVVVFDSPAAAEQALSKGRVWRGADLKISWWTPEEQDLNQEQGYGDELNWYAQPTLFLGGEKTRTITAHKIKRMDFGRSDESDNGKKVEMPKPKETSVPASRNDDDTVQSSRPFEKRKALTAREKFQVLEERDRLLRGVLGKDSNIKTAVAMRGKCPDMCPEKERLMRDVRRMVSVYEMSSDTGELDPKLAVKQYSRSSADQEEPLEHELRPEPVLTMTMSYLITRVMCRIDRPDENLSEWYDFCWDRLRAIRKDIVQQQLCDINTVSIVEQCARFHICCFDRLLGTDISIFDEKINTENLMNCLKALINMYEDLRKQGIVCPNEAEFNAYMILLKLNSGDILWEYQNFPSVLQSSPVVQEAVRIHTTYNNNAYSTYFKIVRETSYLNACLMQRFFTHVRVRALRTIIKAYCPPNVRGKLPLSLVTEALKFDSLEETISFCETYGISLADTRMDFIVFRNELMQHESTQCTVKYPSSLVTRNRVTFPQAVVGINNPIPVHVDLEVHNSFDDNHVLTNAALDASDQEEKLLRDTALRGLLKKKYEKMTDVPEPLLPSEKTPSPPPRERATSEGSNVEEDVFDYPLPGESREESAEEDSDSPVSSPESKTSDEETCVLSDSGPLSVGSLSSSPGMRTEKFNFTISPQPAKHTPFKFSFPEPMHVDSTVHILKSPEILEPVKKPSEIPKKVVAELFKVPPSPDVIKRPPTPKSLHDDLVMQKLKKKLHENMKRISARKCAKIWRQKVARIKKSRCMDFDRDLPFLCHPVWCSKESQEGSGTVWKEARKWRTAPVPLVQRLNRYRRMSAVVRAILRSDVVDRLHPDVKLTGPKIANWLGKNSLEYAFRCANISQPPTVFWKMIFSLPENKLGSTLPEKLVHWCNEAFYTGESQLGDVQFRLSDCGVPVYTSVRVLEGSRSLSWAKNMSSLIFVRVEGCESSSETKQRLKDVLGFKNHPIPVAILNLGDFSEPLNVDDIKEEFTTIQESSWSSPGALMDAFRALVRGFNHVETGVERLLDLLNIIVDKFVDSLHEDSYLNDGLALVLTEPINIIELFNILVEKIQAVLSACYSKNIYGTACEFRPQIEKLKRTERFPERSDNPKFLNDFCSKISGLKMNPFADWPPKNSLQLFEILKNYCGQIGCGGDVLSKIIRMINPPDDEATDRELMAHLFRTNWLHILEILIKENIRSKQFNFNVVYLKSEIRNLWDSHWWMYTDSVIKANKTLDSW